EGLPRNERRELVAEIRAHLEEGAASDASDAAVRNLIDNLGEPETIVASAGPGPASARPGRDRGARRAPLVDRRRGHSGTWLARGSRAALGFERVDDRAEAARYAGASRRAHPCGHVGPDGGAGDATAVGGRPANPRPRGGAHRRRGRPAALCRASDAATAIWGVTGAEAKRSPWCVMSS